MDQSRRNVTRKVHKDMKIGSKESEENSEENRPEVGKCKNMPPISQISIDNNVVLKLLKRLDVHKAMGPEGIPNIVLKNCANEILQGLCTVFQCSPNTGTLPSDWHNANITPVFKKGQIHSEKIIDQSLSRLCLVKYLSISFVATC